MGGLRKKMPVTFWTFLVGTLALCGVPPFSGFYSKDAILAQAWHAAQLSAVHPGGVRCGADDVLHVPPCSSSRFSANRPIARQCMRIESPGVMIWPLRILAVLSVDRRL